LENPISEAQKFSLLLREIRRFQSYKTQGAIVKSAKLIVISMEDSKLHPLKPSE